MENCFTRKGYVALVDSFHDTEVKQVRIETELEADGRWIAEVVELAGVMTYGITREEAISRAEALALRVIADRLENGEEIPELNDPLARSDYPQMAV